MRSEDDWDALRTPRSVPEARACGAKKAISGDAGGFTFDAILRRRLASGHGRLQI